MWGIDPATLAVRLESEQDASIRRALIQALGTGLTEANIAGDGISIATASSSST